MITLPALSLATLLVFLCRGASMGPERDGARVVVDTAFPFDKVRVGMVVTAKTPWLPYGYTTHRVVEVHPGWLWTKGDACKIMDGFRVTPREYVGVEVGVVPPPSLPHSAGLPSPDLQREKTF